jgi:outer membrane scaffolding protein for murein synthesis (MipA/OmpV family)
MSVTTQMMMKTGIAFILCALTGSAMAQSDGAVHLRAAAINQDVRSLGLAAVQITPYQGSDENWNLLLPYADFQWKNGWFAGVGNGIGYDFSSTPMLNFGLRITPEIGRKQSRSVKLKGMGDIKPSAQLGGFFNFNLNNEFSMTSSARYGYGDDRKGALAELGLAYNAQLKSGWSYGLGASISYANQSYMQTYFGVDAKQASRTKYARYQPKAGFKSLDASVRVTYAMTPEIALTFEMQQNRLFNLANQSPLTQTRNRTNGILALSYDF